MPTFDTPQPIQVTIELGVGDIRVQASERTDTIVEVGPSDRTKKPDVTAAAETRVEYADGRLLIKAAKGWRQWTPRGGGESIDVQIALPAGSDLRGSAGIAALRCTGRLGECRFKTGIGELRLEQAGPAELKTGGGDITVDRAVSHAELTTGTGAVRVGSIDGTAVIKNINGDTWIGRVSGELSVNAANGRIVVDRADASVTAKTANGDVRVNEIAGGAVHAQTARGTVEVAIGDGAAAWLDLAAHCGNVHNGLDAAARPHADENAVEVRARSAFGDITVRRSVHPPTDLSEGACPPAPVPAHAERQTVSDPRPVHRP